MTSSHDDDTLVLNSSGNRTVNTRISSAICHFFRETPDARVRSVAGLRTNVLFVLVDTMGRMNVKPKNVLVIRRALEREIGLVLMIVVQGPTVHNCTT